MLWLLGSAYVFNLIVSKARSPEFEQIKLFELWIVFSVILYILEYIESFSWMVM